MRAVVLVGGRGTRLRPLTYRIPKQLLPVAEVPMLERSLAALATHGVDSVVLSMGYRPDAFRAAFPDDRCAGVALDYAVEPEPLDTGGGIAFAARHAGLAERFLVLNGDVLQSFDIGALVSFHERAGAEATLALAAVPDPSDFGLVVAAPDGKVTSFVEKGRPRAEGMGNLINAGVYVFEPSMLDRLPETTPIHIETDVFPALASEGRLSAREMPGWWVDVGNLERYLRATADVLCAGAPPAPGATDRGDGVWVTDALGPEGDVEAPALLGAGAIVHRGARVRGSVVGAGAVIETGARVDGSAVLAGATVGSGAVVSCSIVAPDVTIPAGERVEARIVDLEAA